MIGISHEGGTAATNRALEAAAAAGARAALITGSAGSPAGRAAAPEIVVETVEMDQSWCHTVGYLSPILAAAAIGARAVRHRPSTPTSSATSWPPGPPTRRGAEAIAGVLAGCRTILTVASGADRPAARELALKIEEAAWVPSAMRDLETFLHGHLPATDASTGLVLILADRDGRDAERIERAPAGAGGGARSSGSGPRRSSAATSTRPSPRS